MEKFVLSLLNDFLFCPRRAALKMIEGWRGTNMHTILGDIGHEHADLPGYEVAKGVLVWRALPVWSERLGLSGKCDLVEVVPDPKTEIGNPKSIAPVEYKKGKRRPFDNDDAQLCAQALCLEEMFGIPVERGAVFHAASKRRREVVFSPELRQLTEAAIGDLRAMLEQSEIHPLPSAVFKPACEECSLYEICLPRLTANPESVQRAARQLFEI